MPLTSTVKVTKTQKALSSAKKEMSKHYISLLVLFWLTSFCCGEVLPNNTANGLRDTETFYDKNAVLSKQKEISGHSAAYENDMQEFETVLSEYIQDVLNRKKINIMPGVYIQKKPTNDANKSNTKSVDKNLIWTFKRFTDTHALQIDMGRAFQGTGRLFFFKGLKKLMWPLFIGMQVVKTVLLVLFLPSIIGSVGKIVGKGLPGLSNLSGVFSQPNTIDTVDDLEFKDNSLNSDHGADGAYTAPYQYNIPDSKNSNFVSQMYESAQANNALSRLGLDKVSYVNTPTSRYRNNGFSTKRDDFKIFHDIPSSSLLLTNYDPFYSPLLSRLDSVFQQLGLGTDEICREKLVCLMYSNPAKYAPYSNLVSAQLSRELNELRKPTSDNPDILRFFKYMRAAKDGQDAIDCETSYKECVTFNDMSGPAMINTFNDINKLVQARKLH